MPRSKEIPEDLRRKVVEAHQSGKGYKLISKALGLPKTTIRAILRKWKRFGTVVTLPRSGRPSKISPRARREIIREVMKNPCTTSKDLQATLASSNIRVHQSTIRRILGIHGRPTLSSFEGSIALQTPSQEEEGMLEASDGSSRDVKLEVDNHVLENSKIDYEIMDSSDKDDAKCPDNGGDDAVDDENCDDGEMASTDVNGAGDDKNEKCHGEITSTNVNGASDDEETTSTNHNGGGDEHRDVENEKCGVSEMTQKDDNGGGDDVCQHEDVETTPTNHNGGGDDKNTKCDVEMMPTVYNGGGGDVDNGDGHDGDRCEVGHATGDDANSAYNNNNNNNNNNGENWSAEMDYITSLTFS